MLRNMSRKKAPAPSIDHTASCNLRWEKIVVDAVDAVDASIMRMLLYILTCLRSSRSE